MHPYTGFQEVEAPRISRQSAHEGDKVSPTHRPPLPPGNILGTHLCFRMSRPQGHSAAGRTMSIKNTNDTIGKRSRDLPVCSAVPQPTAPLYLKLSLTSHIKNTCWTSILIFRHRASCILGQAFHYSPENAFYIFNQQIYFII